MIKEPAYRVMQKHREPKLARLHEMLIDFPNFFAISLCN